MAKFAKLFDLADGEQVLVVIGTNDYDEYQVKFTTDIDGVRMDLAPTFKRKDPTKPGDPAVWAQACFDNVDQDQAVEMRAKMVKFFNENQG